MRANNAMGLATVALWILAVRCDLLPVAAVAAAGFEDRSSPILTSVIPISNDRTEKTGSAAAEGISTGADLEAPTVLKVTGSDSFDRITITFSEPVDPRSSTDASNYRLPEEISILSVLQPDPVTIRLMTSRMQPDTNYTLTIVKISDSAGNRIPAPGIEITFRSFTFTSGLVKSEIWTGIEGATVADLIADPRFPAAPDLTEYALKLEWGAKDQEGVGVRISAYLTPSESASYVFYMAASHEAELYLSTDENPENRARIAAEHVPHLARSWSSSNLSAGCPEACENRSAPIRLAAGNRYYLELIFTDGIGVGYSGVNWAREGEPSPINGTRPLSGDQIGVFADPSQLINGSGIDDAIITSVSLQDGNIVIEFSGEMLESADHITGPWTIMPGASSPARLPASGGQKFYRVP